MLRENQQIRTLAIVIIGNFNPAIIQPFWLSKKNLIKESDAENARDVLIHDQLTQFNLGWVAIEISLDKMRLLSNDERSFEAVRDLAVGLFTCLSETPVKAVGINHIIHYLVPDKQQYLLLGNRLAPFSNWSGVLDDPKLNKIELIEQLRRDKFKGHVIVNIEPSHMLNGRNGIALTINDHLSLDDNETDTNNGLLERLKAIWDNSKQRMIEISDNINNILKSNDK